jgi:hypothetical protein
MDGERVTLNIRRKDVTLLCNGLSRLWGDTNEAVENTKRMKEKARGKAYEDEMDEIIKVNQQTLEDIADLYTWLWHFRSQDEKEEDNT